MAFDPDAYLKQTQGTFNPDEYLQKTGGAGGFDPDAYLAAQPERPLGQNEGVRPSTPDLRENPPKPGETRIFKDNAPKGTFESVPDNSEPIIPGEPSISDLVGKAINTAASPFKAANEAIASPSKLFGKEAPIFDPAKYLASVEESGPKLAEKAQEKIGEFAGSEPPPMLSETGRNAFQTIKGIGAGAASTALDMAPTTPSKGLEYELFGLGTKALAELPRAGSAANEALAQYFPKMADLLFKEHGALDLVPQGVQSAMQSAIFNVKKAFGIPQETGLVSWAKENLAQGKISTADAARMDSDLYNQMLAERTKLPESEPPQPPPAAPGSPPLASEPPAPVILPQNPPSEAYTQSLATKYGEDAPFYVPGLGPQSGVNRMAISAKKLSDVLSVTPVAVTDALTRAQTAYDGSLSVAGDPMTASAAANKAFWQGIPLRQVMAKMGISNPEAVDAYMEKLKSGDPQTSQELMQTVVGNDPEMKGLFPPAPAVAPLRPEAIEPTSASASRPPGPGWISDPGAVPGEPSLIYKNKMAIIEHTNDQGTSLYEVTDTDGQSHGFFPDLEIAKRSAESVVNKQFPSEPTKPLEPRPIYERLTTEKKAKGFNPISDIRRMGGLSTTDPDTLEMRNQDVPFSIFRKGGRSLDDLRESWVEAGILPREATLDDVKNVILDHLAHLSGGKKNVSVMDDEELNRHLDEQSRQIENLKDQDLLNEMEHWSGTLAREGKLYVREKQRLSDLTSEFKRRFEERYSPKEINPLESLDLPDTEFVRLGRKLGMPDTIMMREAYTDQTNVTTAFNRKYVEAMGWDKKPTIHFDLDNFKKINDTWGHPIGDRALNGVVALAKEYGFNIARIGGEEFGVFLLNNENPIDFVNDFRSFQNQLNDLEIHDLEGKLLFTGINVSAGFGRDLAEADKFSYKAKRSGKDSIVFDKGEYDATIERGRLPNEWTWPENTYTFKRGIAEAVPREARPQRRSGNPQRTGDLKPGTGQEELSPQPPQPEAPQTSEPSKPLNPNQPKFGKSPDDKIVGYQFDMTTKKMEPVTRAEMEGKKPAEMPLFSKEAPKLEAPPQTPVPKIELPPEPEQSQLSLESNNFLPVGGGVPPEKGLVVANIGSDGKIYYGKPGEIHAELSEQYPHENRGNWKQVGFADSTGKFFNREQAYGRAQELKIRLAPNTGSSLDTTDLRGESSFQRPNPFGPGNRPPQENPALKPPQTQPSKEWPSEAGAIAIPDPKEIAEGITNDKGTGVAQRIRDFVTIDPVPALTRAGVGELAIEHAANRIATPHLVNDLLSRVFPTQYKNPEAMAKTIDILNKDNILKGYDTFLENARVELDKGNYLGHAKWMSAANAIAEKHDLKLYDAEVKAAANDKTISANIRRWKEVVNPLMDSLYNEVKDVDPNTEREGRGRHFDTRINLLPKNKADKWFAAMSDEKLPLPEPSVSNYRNPNVKHDPFDRSAKFTGEYSTDANAILTSVLAPRWNEVTKIRLYKSLVDKGIAIIAEPGTEAPVSIQGEDVARLPIKFPETGPDGKTRMIEKSLYVRRDMVREIRDSLGTDMRMTQNPVARFLTNIQLAQVSDAITHSKNILTAITRAQGAGSVWKDLVRKIPVLGNIDGIVRIFHVIHEVMADTPEIRAEIAGMAKEGLIRPVFEPSGVSKITHAQQMIHKFDTAARIILNRFYSDLVRRGLKIDTPGARRAFINEVGQYNSRLMGPMMRELRDMGIAPFIVAGRNFNRLGRRLITGDPGAGSSSASASAQMRFTNLFGNFLLFTIPMMLNTLITGKPGGRSGTQVGEIDLGGKEDEQGKHKTLDLFQIAGMRRGIRSVGLEALIEGVRTNQSLNQITGKAIEQAGQTALHPWLGPAIGFVAKTATGRQLDMRGHMTAMKIPGGGGKQYLENFRAALESQNPLVYSMVQPAFKNIGLDDKPRDAYADELGNTFLKSPFSAFGIKDEASDTAKRITDVMADQGINPSTSQSAALRKMLDRARSGEKVMPEAQEAAKSGTFTMKQIMSLARRSHMTGLQDSFSRLPLNDAMNIYEKATPEEKKSLEPMLAKKMENNMRYLPMDLRRPMMERFKSANRELVAR